MSQEYTNYITQHVANVQKAADWLYAHNIISKKMSLGLHDVSKYSDEEYKAYDDYFYGNRTEEIVKAFDYAWLHHLHNNPHHWQYWIIKIDNGKEKALEMPEEDVYEMICDWWSFSFKTGDLYEIFDWYEKHKGMVLHPNTRKLVEDILDKIKKALDEEKK